MDEQKGDAKGAKAATTEGGLGTLFPNIDDEASWNDVHREPIRQEVVLTDVHIPFGSMVMLLVKFAIAAIPAAVILGVLGGVAVAVFSAAFLHR